MVPTKTLACWKAFIEGMETHVFNVNLFAVSGRAEIPRIKQGVARAEALGWTLGDLPPYGGAEAPQEGYLAGDDASRRASLESALVEEASLAWALRGGYGAARLAPFAAMPLAACPVLGFSDVTTLLAAVHQAGGCAIHGPVLTSFGEADEGTVTALQACLSGAPRSWSLDGEAAPFEGAMLGGNLEVLTRLIGTSLAPRYAGRVVVLEDVGEPWYRCDRALTHLLSASDLSEAQAIILGDFHHCEAATVDRLRARVLALGVPCLAGAPVGHGVTNHAFVWGERVHYDGAQLTLTGQQS
jgi:muramoyltetrapeptide carboxypeptidase